MLPIEGVAQREVLERDLHLYTTTIPAGEHRYGNVQLGFMTPAADLFRWTLSAAAGCFFDGRQLSASASPTWNVSKHLEIRGLYSVDRIAFDARDQHFTAQVTRLRSRIMLYTRLSLASFIQYNSAADTISVNARLRYNPGEGHDLYLVYNDGLNTDRFAVDPVRRFTDAGTVMLKYSRTIDLAF